MSQDIATICKSISKLSPITPKIYKSLTDIYHHNNGKLSVNDIYFILYQNDKENEKQLLSKIIQFNSELDKDEELLYMEAKEMIESQIQKLHKKNLKKVSKQLKPLLLKIIPNYSFYQYNKMAR